MKIYKCSICHQEIQRKDLLRLVKQINDKKECYSRNINVHNYDFCEKCYMKFDNWIKKYKEEK